MADIIEVEVFNKLFASIAEEMGIILAKSAFSPNIKERRDFSCAIFDTAGELVAQAAHIPVHLGAMAMTVKHALTVHDFAAGDMMILNDPFNGGSHLPDITLIAPVCNAAAEVLFYVANRAHHADVGGRMPGSMGMISDLADEGILIPPTILYRHGMLDKPFIEHFLGRVRNPVERQGDLRAQTAALHRGQARLLALTDKYGMDHLLAVLARLSDYAERLMRSAIGTIPDGSYSFVDYLDDDGINQVPLPIGVRLTVDHEHAEIDFRQCAQQVPSPLNTVKSVTRSAVVYVFQCLVGDGYPINEGSYRPLTVITRPGTLLDALPPAPVAAGNVETSQRIVDVLLGALAKAIPHRIPAASCGSMNNIAIGSLAAGSINHFTYYETIGGGMGARPDRPGLDGIHTHMTNTLNTPIEALEHAYPLQVERYGLRRNSGGQGLHRGGDGIVRQYRFLDQAHVSLLTERRRLSPYGLAGGHDGRRGENVLIRDGRHKRLTGKINFIARPADRLVLKTPSGGGWGACP
jgi:N-methylhydantoinase B